MSRKRIFVGAAVAAALAGVAYLSAVGCCQLIAAWGKPASLSDRLKLSPTQRRAIASMEKRFIGQKRSACQRLCAKRAQMIQLLKQPVPDSGTLDLLVQEIAREQATLERGTLEHLLRMRAQLEPAQQERMTVLLSDQLRSACRMTACGDTPGCAVVEADRKR